MAFLRIQCQVTTSAERWELVREQLSDPSLGVEIAYELVTHIGYSLNKAEERWREENPRWRHLSALPTWYWQSPLTITDLKPEECEAIKKAW